MSNALESFTPNQDWWKCSLRGHVLSGMCTLYHIFINIILQKNTQKHSKLSFGNIQKQPVVTIAYLGSLAKASLASCTTTLS